MAKCQPDSRLSQEHIFVRKIAINKLNIIFMYTKNRTDSRLYELLHPDMGNWGGDAVPQSTVIWVWYKRNRHKNIYLFEK